MYVMIGTHVAPALSSDKANHCCVSNLLELHHTSSAIKLYKLRNYTLSTRNYMYLYVYLNSMTIHVIPQWMVGAEVPKCTYHMTVSILSGLYIIHYTVHMCTYSLIYVVYVRSALD